MEEGVQVLTVYAFSTENWKREEKEVEVLMTIFVKYAERCEREALEKDIRIKVFCTDRTRLPPGVIAAIDKVRPRLLARSVPLRCEPSPSSLTPDSPRN